MRTLNVDYNARPPSIAMDRNDADMVAEERRSVAAMRRKGERPSEGLVLNSRTILDGTDNRKLRTADGHKCKRCGMTVPQDEMEVHAMHCRHSKASLTVQEIPDSSRLRAKPCEPASIPAIGAMRRLPSVAETSLPPRSPTVPPTGCRKPPSGPRPDGDISNTLTIPAYDDHPPPEYTEPTVYSDSKISSHADCLVATDLEALEAAHLAIKSKKALQCRCSIM